MHFLNEIVVANFLHFYFQVIVRHLSKFITNRIDADLEKRTLFISLTVPMVKIRGNYRVNGNVFVFQISGNGPFQVSKLFLEFTWLIVTKEPFLFCWKAIDRKIRLAHWSKFKISEQFFETLKTTKILLKTPRKSYLKKSKKSHLKTQKIRPKITLKKPRKSDLKPQKKILNELMDKKMILAPVWDTQWMTTPIK